jgi:hypothetical protein
MYAFAPCKTVCIALMDLVRDANPQRGEIQSINGRKCCKPELATHTTDPWDRVL